MNEYKNGQKGKEKHTKNKGNKRVGQTKSANHLKEKRKERNVKKTKISPLPFFAKVTPEKQIKNNKEYTKPKQNI